MTIKNIRNFFTTKIIGLIHNIYLSQLKNRKRFISSTKTKSEVRGGGRKPWRQKGTGNARAGSIRSPLWKGGGIIFGPKPHNCKKKINKKQKSLALIYALFLKKKNFIFINDNLLNNFENIKTKNIINFLKNYNINNLKTKILILINKYNKNFYLSTRNIKNIKLSTISCLNLIDLLNHKIIITSIKTFNIYLLNYLI